jgi:EmrB/QacA subfamily drug resistance transporter
MTSSRTRWLGLLFISIAVSLIIVDSTIVNVVVPYIVRDLGITSTQVQWVQESYTLVFAAFLLVFGSLADRYGRRRLMILGIAIFAISSVLAAFAPTGDLLIGARVLQGVGGAMILPTTLSIINATFRGKDRGIAFAIWGSTIGGMAAVGPLLGGWLTTAFDWRWVFGINVPLGIIIIIGVLTFITESQDATPRRVDIVGAILTILTTGFLVFGLIEGRTYGWWFASADVPATWALAISPVPFAFLITVLSGVAFVAWGLRRERAGKSTMLSFGLFKVASFRNGNIAALIVSLGEFGIILSLPLWLQNVLGYDALQTGFVILALAIGSFMASGFAGAMSNRVSAVWIVRVGILAEIVGVFSVGLVLTTTTGWFPIAAGLFVYGFGVGLATAQLTNVVLKDVPVEKSGQGSGTQSTSRQVGSALGIAILGTILFSSLGANLDARLAERDLPEAARTQIVDVVVKSAGTAIPGLESQYPEAAADAREAFTDGTRYSAFAAAGFLALGFLATLRLDGRKEDHSEDVAPTAKVEAGP